MLHALRFYEAGDFSKSCGQFFKRGKRPKLAENGEMRAESAKRQSKDFSIHNEVNLR
jgi:hypothetical protein